MAQYQEHGFVVGTISISRGDTPRDEDRFPDIVAATTEVYFDRMKGQEVQSDPARIVSYERITAKILPSGELTGDLDEADNLRMDPQGQIISKPGVWLTVGQYEISFSSGGLVPPANPLLVTTAHTEAAPVDITSAYNEAPPPSAPVKLVSLPMATSSNVIMGWDATLAEPTWFEPQDVIEVTPTAAFEYTDEEVARGLGEAKRYADTEIDKGVSRANSYTNAHMDGIVVEANAYTDQQADFTLSLAKSYADSQSTAAIEAAATHAEAQDAEVLATVRGEIDAESILILNEADSYAVTAAGNAVVTANEYTFNRTQQALTSARSYTDSEVASAVLETKSHADTKAGQALADAKVHADSTLR